MVIEYLEIKLILTRVDMMLVVVSTNHTFMYNQLFYTSETFSLYNLSTTILSIIMCIFRVFRMCAETKFMWPKV